MGSEDSTDSSVSAQKEKGTTFGSKLKGAFGSMAKAVKGSKPEKGFFGREKVKDDYIESLECINGIHSNSDPELPDITKRNVMPGRFAKVEAPKIRTEIRPKTYEVMDEAPAEDTEEEDPLETFEVVEDEPVKVSEIDVIPAAAEPVAEPVFIKETERRFYEEETEEETEEGEVDYFDFLPPMKATERTPVRRVPQSRTVVDIDECVDSEEEIDDETDDETDDEEHVRTKEEVFIDLFDDTPETPAVKADVHDEPAVADDVPEEIPADASDVYDGPLCTEIDLDILDVPVTVEVQELEVIVEMKAEAEVKVETETISEAAIEKEIAVEEEIIMEAVGKETEIRGTTKEEMFIDLFDNIDETPVRTVIDLDILDAPVASAIREEKTEEDDEPETIPEVHIPIEMTEAPMVQETQRAVPEAAVPVYGRISIDFDAFDRAAESPLDSRFDVEEVEHAPQAEVSFDIASLESVSIPTVGEEAMVEAEVQVSPINVEIDLTGLETAISPINVEIDYESLETLVSPINVEIDYESLETLVSPINVVIDLAGLKTQPSPINVEIDLTGLETPVSPINVEIDMMSLTARTIIEVQTEDHSEYIPNFILVNDEDIIRTESELSVMMPETVLKAFDSEHEFLEIDVFDAAEESCDLEIDESEIKEFLEIDESEIKEFLEIDESEIKEFLEIDESEITEVHEVSAEPNYLEVDVLEIKEFLEIDESEIKEFLEIDESEITEVSAVPAHKAETFVHAEGTEEKGGIFFSFFTKEDKDDNISISFGETKEDDDVMDDSNESVSVRDDFAVTVSSVDGSRKLFI